VGLVLAHIVIVLPFALRLTLASAVGLDRAIEHAAISLGASDWTVLRRITLPLVLPGLASGWALAFINSFDEVTMTVFIAAPGTETLPGAHVPLHPGQYRPAGDLGVGLP
jgi:ABC-type spermidine/putrescine transport system, permease component II